MLEIIIPSQHYEFFDEKNNEFVNVDVKETKLQLEHSLISISRWEQKYHKPFLANKEKTFDEICGYIECMTLSHGIDPNIYKWIPNKVVDEVIEYIKNPMTATTFNESNLVGAQKTSREIVTSEIIYYWMIGLNIPVEFQKWHLNRLLTLIKVVNIKNDKDHNKKVDKRAAARERARLNAERRAKYNSKG